MAKEGWANQELRLVAKEIKTWPSWMQKSAATAPKTPTKRVSKSSRHSTRAA
jgi:hypothetical protein